MFYIVTPSYRAMPWLECCLRSVYDQCGPYLCVHHHVQDGGSDDGTCLLLQNWAKTHRNCPFYHFSYESTADKGMYDALNRAWKHIPRGAQMSSQLNADEQFLPHTLACVKKQFETQPLLDALLGSYLVLSADMTYLCHRRPVRPKLWSSWLNCACITNATFYRVRAFSRYDMSFDASLRCAGDMVFYRSLLQQGLRFGLMDVVCSAFICTGNNLAWTPLAQQEEAILRRAAPLYARLGASFIRKWVNGQRYLRDLILSSPRSFSVYLPQQEERTLRLVPHPTHRYPRIYQ